MRWSKSSNTKIFPSEPTLFRILRALDSSMRTVLLVSVMSAIVPGSSRRSLNGRAVGIPDAVGGALLFAVVGVSLVVSWLVAVLFTPLTGVFILPEKLKGHGKHRGGAFSLWFHKHLDLALRHSRMVLGASVGLFALANGYTNLGLDQRATEALAAAHQLAVSEPR